MIINSIAAVSENGAIGINQQLPWRLPNDLRFFKKMTSNKIVLMGRKSYEAIGKPLPNRENWVLTHRLDWQAEGVRVFNTWEQVQAALAAEKAAEEELFIIGGGEIYRQTLPFWNRLYLTKVHSIITQADTFFPDWNTDGSWVLMSEEQHQADEKHAYAYTFQCWEKQ